MKLKTRILIIVAAALLGMTIMAANGLFNLRQSMFEERRTQIALLLDLAHAQIAHYHALETSGKLSREEAQARAQEAIGALRNKDDYFVIRRLADNVLLVHANAQRIGKVDAGAKMPDGRPIVEHYKEAMAKSRDGKGYAETQTIRPGSEDKTLYRKLTGAVTFKPWEWVIVIGFFVDDIEREFREDALRLLLIGIVLLGVVATLAFRAMRSILGDLGGEPGYAAQIAQGIAQGDLSQAIETQGRSDSLLGSMRTMRENLHGMVEHFNGASQTLSGASEKLSSETRQISEGSQMIAESTASTAAAIEEMTVSINHISDNARETEHNSHQAAELAVQGEKLASDAAGEIRRIATDITDASELIRGLVDRSREIDGMSNVIKEIADQTNLLALNAAIEAARAGEQGRGFAVVADEVRKLAERTSGATQDITRTIRAVQGDTDTAAARMEGVREQVALGVDLAEKAAQALRDINDGARATLAKTREVADAAKEQSEASNSIAGNIERIAQMVERADVSVQQAHVQVRELDALARELNTAAARFRL